MKRIVTTWLSAVALAELVAAPLAAQGVASGLGVKRQAAQSPVERVRSALSQAGISVCAPVLLTAAQFIFDAGDGDFSIQPLGPDVNRWPVVLTIESQHTAVGHNRLTVITIAPAGTCSGSYEQVITWPQSCQVLKSTVFADFKGERLFYRSVRTSELTAGIQLFLMPSGTGCVSIKKELIG